MKRWIVGMLSVTLVTIALSLAPRKAWAGESYIGTILASDAGSSNNFMTGYLSAGCSTETGVCPQAFKIPINTPISIQCDEAAVVSVNEVWADAGRGIAVPAGALLTSSTNGGVTYTGIGGRVDDAGTKTGGVVAVTAGAGTSSARCRIFKRVGNE